MAIEVTHEGAVPRYWPKEPCAFCKAPTSHWYAPKDVPVCLDCATGVDHEDVPSKRGWLNANGAALRANWTCAADRRAATTAAMECVW